MIDSETVRLKVAGELACFTRPEMKVERMTYPVMTPSAARGVLEAVLWKPEIVWHVRRIVVLNPIRYVSIRRNEVQGKISTGEVNRWIADPSTYQPYFADSAGRDGLQGENRTQRNTVALRDVAYVIEASVAQPRGFSSTDPPIKYREMFLRRAERGQCFQQPYLGLREFAVSRFELASGDESPAPELVEAGDFNLGWMLFDLDYRGESPQPLFAPARLNHGVLDVEAMRTVAEPIQPEEVPSC